MSDNNTIKHNFCKECGAPLEAGAKFCSNCGTKVDRDITFNDGTDETTKDLVPDSGQANNENSETIKPIENENSDTEKLEPIKNTDTQGKTDALVEVKPEIVATGKPNTTAVKENPIMIFLVFIVGALLVIFLVNAVVMNTNGVSGKPKKNGFDSKTNEVYSFLNYKIEIPTYWGNKTIKANRVRYYAETSGKVAMLMISTEHEIDDDYPVTFEGLARDNENMIKGIEESVGCKVKKSETFKIGNIKGMRYKFDIQSTDSQPAGYGEWFVFPSEQYRSWCYVMLSQSDNTEYDYTNDFNRILRSIQQKTTETATTNYSGGGRSSSPASSANNAKTNNSTVDPKLKRFLDEYEDFMDQYIVFMRSMDYSDAAALAEYAELMNKYSDYMSAVAAYDTDSMSEADALYYSEVTLRVSQKLLKAAS